jgi:hypothetical protein
LTLMAEAYNISRKPIISIKEFVSAILMTNLCYDHSLISSFHFEVTLAPALDAIPARYGLALRHQLLTA